MVQWWTKAEPKSEADSVLHWALDTDLPGDLGQVSYFTSLNLSHPISQWEEKHLLCGALWGLKITERKACQKVGDQVPFPLLNLLGMPQKYKTDYI